MTLTKEQEEEVLGRWLAGETQAQVATAFGVTQSIVSRTCRYLLRLRDGGSHGVRQGKVSGMGGRLFVHKSTGKLMGEVKLKAASFVPGLNPQPLVQPLEVLPGEATRFWRMVRINSTEVNACWEWDCAVMASGYGTFSEYDPVRKRSTGKVAHRVAWRITYGPIPPKMYIGHRCDNPPCVRPNHLFLCTPSENARDCTTKGRGKQGWRLTWDKVKEIRRLREKENWTIVKLAQKFDVVHSQISNIINYRQWVQPLRAVDRLNP